MEAYIFLFFSFWILLGLQALAPHLTAKTYGDYSKSVKFGIFIFYIIMGPVIAISYIINAIVYFLGDEDDEDGG